MNEIMNLLINNGCFYIHPFILATHIVAMSDTLQVDPVLVTKIVIVESHGNPEAYNELTHDWGIMQVHGSRGKMCGPNWDCNLYMGMSVLAKSGRVCEYNLGPKGKKKKYKRTCEGYEKKIRSVK